MTSRPSRGRGSRSAVVLAAGSDPEVVSDEIDGYVSSLLGMIGISGDPLSSREHILLANIIQNAWSQGQGLDLATLLAQVQQPPMRKLGVLDLEQFFPAPDRAALAIRINSLLASPRYGERLAWEWLDAARYADSNGYQGDGERTMWPWRDWVIRSFNDNLPFDKFITWQLAGEGSNRLDRHSLLIADSDQPAARKMDCRRLTTACPCA